MRLRILRVRIRLRLTITDNVAVARNISFAIWVVCLQFGLVEWRLGVAVVVCGGYGVLSRSVVVV